MTGEPLDLDAIEQRDTEWGPDLRALLAEVKRLRARLDAVQELHAPDRDGWCDGCNFSFPCRTIRALGGAS